MAHYGVSVTIKGTTYNYVLDYKKGVRELLLGATAPVDKVEVYEESYGQTPRLMTAEEVLTIVLDHPAVEVEEVKEEAVVLVTTSA